MTEAPRVFSYKFRTHVFWRLCLSAMLIANIFSSFIVGSCWESVVWDLTCFNSISRRIICELIPFAYQCSLCLLEGGCVWTLGLSVGQWFRAKAYCFVKCLCCLRLFFCASEPVVCSVHMMSSQCFCLCMFCSWDVISVSVFLYSTLWLSAVIVDCPCQFDSLFCVDLLFALFRLPASVF